uniref:Chimerin 1 n=1 Tax=Homo sapiens TaxID=9606 RepID=A0A494C1H3_HUMAN
MALTLFDTDEYRPPVWKSYCGKQTKVLWKRVSWHDLQRSSRPALDCG